jgi:hypothetical protein
MIALVGPSFRQSRLVEQGKNYSPLAAPTQKVTPNGASLTGQVSRGLWQHRKQRGMTVLAAFRRILEVPDVTVG